MPRKYKSKTERKKASDKNARVKALKESGAPGLADGEMDRRGAIENIKLICEATKSKWLVPESLKAAVLARQIDAAVSDPSNFIASMAFNALMRGEERELKERALVLKEREVSLKEGLVDGILAGSVPIAASELVDGLEGLVDEIARRPKLLASRSTGEGDGQGSYEARSTLPLPVASDGESGPVAERTA